MMFLGFFLFFIKYFGFVVLGEENVNFIEKKNLNGEYFKLSVVIV